VPVFAAKQTSLNDDQKDWITRRVKDGAIRSVVCTANYSSKSTKADIKKYQLRAKNACDFAKSMVGGLGVPPIVSTKMVKIAASTLAGSVFLTFDQ
jgi:aconitase B